MMKIKKILFRIVLIGVFSFMIVTPKYSSCQENCANQFLYLALLANAWQVEEPIPSFFPTNKYGLSYAMLESIGIDPTTMDLKEFIETEVLSEKVLFYKEDSTTIRPFYVLLHKEIFFLLSSKLEDELCDYKENIFLFIPSSGYLEKVQKDFSFSFKKDLIKKFNEQLGFSIQDEEYKNYCEVLLSLKEENWNKLSKK